MQRLVRTKNLYEVDEIVEHKPNTDEIVFVKKYKIKWKGFPSKHNSWEQATTRDVNEVLRTKK